MEARKAVTLKNRKTRATLSTGLALSEVAPPFACLSRIESILKNCN